MFFSDTQCSNIRSRGVSTDFRLGGPRWGAPLPSQLGDLGNAMLSPLRSAAQPQVSQLKKILHLVISFGHGVSWSSAVLQLPRL